MSSLFNAMAVSYNEPAARQLPSARSVAIRAAPPAALRFAKQPMKRIIFALVLAAALGDVRLDAAALRPPDRRRPPRRPHRSRSASALQSVLDLLLRPEEGRREDHPARAPLAAVRERHGQQVPLRHLLGLHHHHDRHRRDADPGPVARRSRWRRCSATALGEALYATIDVCTLLVLLVIGFAVFRRIVLQPAPDPDEPRRRRDPGRDRRADDHALRHPRPARRRRGRARGRLPDLGRADGGVRRRACRARRRRPCPRRPGGSTSSSCWRS